MRPRDRAAKPRIHQKSPSSRAIAVRKNFQHDRIMAGYGSDQAASTPFKRGRGHPNLETASGVPARKRACAAQIRNTTRATSISPPASFQLHGNKINDATLTNYQRPQCETLRDGARLARRRSLRKCNSYEENQQYQLAALTRIQHSTLPNSNCSDDLIGRAAACAKTQRGPRLPASIKEVCESHEEQTS